LRPLWSLDPSVNFLNHGSFGACPRPVLALQASLREEMEREPVDFLAARLPARLSAAREHWPASLAPMRLTWYSWPTRPPGKRGAALTGFRSRR